MSSPRLLQPLVVSYIEFAIDLQEVSTRIKGVRPSYELLSDLLDRRPPGPWPELRWFNHCRVDTQLLECDLAGSTGENHREYVQLFAQAWSRLHKAFLRETGQRLHLTYAQPSPLKHHTLVSGVSDRFVFCLMDRPRKPFSRVGFWPFYTATWLSNAGFTCPKK